MRIFFQAIVMLLFLAPMKSEALSCTYRTDTIIGKCSKSSCEKVLYVAYEKAWGPCRQRPVVLDAPIWAKPVLEGELSELDSFEGIRMVQLTLNWRFWLWSDQKKGLEAYREIKAEGGRIEPGDIKFLSEESLSELRSKWKNLEEREYYKYTLIRVIDWTLLALSIVLLAYTVKWFCRILNSSKTNLYLALIVFLQIVWFMLAVGPTLVFVYSVFSLIALVIPFALFFEIGYSIRYWWRKRYSS
ncbi:MAG: hypothetical protein OIF51_10715 [Cellvibrionaceae bacterium]|nr:hypothetical protein [Cellvibrionaceae bacterium]